MKTTKTQPRESVIDPFKLGRQLGSQFPYKFAAGEWRDTSDGPATSDHLRAILALQLKGVFDHDRLLGNDGRVRRVTVQLVDNVLLAIAALQVQS